MTQVARVHWSVSSLTFNYKNYKSFCFSTEKLKSKGFFVCPFLVLFFSVHKPLLRNGILSNQHNAHHHNPYPMGQSLKVCLHVPMLCPSLSQSPSKFNIMSMVNRLNGSGTHSAHQSARHYWHQVKLWRGLWQWWHGVGTCKHTLRMCTEKR